MPIATLSSKRQITIPQELVRHFGLEKGDGLLFIVEGDSARVVPIKRKDLLSLRGSIKLTRPLPPMEELRRIVREERASRHG
jgi:bifunctional DNA-binding transcriptional regulator/antitoxin component of YhaV-PrlF toxin-antitoxin module